MIKWILTGFVAIVAAVAVAGYAVISTIDPEEYRGLIQAKAKEATGRELTISGPIDLAVSLTPSVAVEDVSFANADWGSRPQMVSMKRFELEVAVMPLLSGEIQVNRLILIEPDILLETNSEGAANWELDMAAPAEEETESGIALQSIGEVRIENGRLTILDGATGAETKLALTSLSAKALSTSAPIEIALSGAYNDNPIELEGQVGAIDSLASGPFPINLAAKAGGATLKVDGAIENPQAASGVALRISAEGASLAALGPLAGTAVPDLGAYSFAAKLSQEGQVFRLADLVASIAGIDAKGGLAVSLAGPAPAPQDVDITLSAKGDSVAELGKKVGTDLPDLGAYEVAAHITQDGNLFTIGGLKVAVASSSIAGQAVIELVEGAPIPREVDITVSTRGETLADVGKLIGTELPDLGPYEVTAQITQDGTLFTVGGINVVIAESKIAGQATLELVENVPVPKDIDITVNTKGESLADVGRLVGADLPALGPYVFATRITNEGEAFKLSELNLKLGGSDLAGEVLVSVAGARPSARGSFSSQLLDVADFTDEQGGAATSGEEQAASGSQDSGASQSQGGGGRYVFTEDPLPLEGLQAADADIKLKAATVRLKDGLELTDLDLTLGLENGNLAIKPLVTTLADGKIKADIGLQGGSSPPALAAKISVDKLDYGKLLQTLEGDAQASGKVDLAVDVKGSGASLRQLVSGLDGTAQIVSEQGTINNRLLKIVAVGLTDIMGPLLGGDDQARLNCLVANFDIADGLATSKALVLDTEVFTVAGAGDIALKTEQLGLAMDTATREASLASLAIPFQVKGTMKQPEVIPDPLGAVSGILGSQGGEVGQIGDLIGQMTGQKKGEGGIGANPCVAALQSVGREYKGEIYEEAATEEPAAEPESIEGQAQKAVEGLLDNVLGGGEAAPEGATPAAEQPAAPVEEAVEEGAKKLLKGLFGD